jgi:hypothetical protein
MAYGAWLASSENLHPIQSRQMRVGPQLRENIVTILASLEAPMFKISIALLLAAFVCVSPSMGRGIVMEDIEDAGIYCAIDGVLGLYDLAIKRCKGNLLHDSRDNGYDETGLDSKKCIGFFVAPVCRGTPVNVESRYDVFKTLRVSCKR